jgi:N utilization substance protein A
MLTEILQVAEIVAREKNIEREEVLDAIEQAIQKAGRTKYGQEHDIRAEIDRRTGTVKLTRHVEVVENIENEFTQTDLKHAKKKKADVAVGEFLVDELPPIDFGRIAAQTAKQVITQKVREAVRKHEYEEFKDREGEVVSAAVKRVEFGNVIVDIGGKAEGIMRRDEGLPREHFKPGDRVRAYIYAVRAEGRGPQIFLSRTHPMFMAKLFTQEVPEIYDGVIEIKAVARDPGSRAKIAVVSKDNSIDPVGACVGMRGSRVQAVVQELGGEKIDIIPWSEDPATFVVNALAPAEVAKVVLDEEQGRMDVVVPDEQLSLAIGRRGQNVRLASMLTGWDIDILTEAEESERRQAEFKTRTELFIAALDVDETLAQLLVAEGFRTVEMISETPIDELAEIQGFDADLAGALVDRANAWLEAEAKRAAAKLKELGITDDLKNFSRITPVQLIKLGEAGVKSLDDLADLAGDELVEIIGKDTLREREANEIIMAARAHWFPDAVVADGAPANENA